VSAGAPQRAQDTSSPTTLLTRVTRIFQKSVFTEATPAARTGHPAGLFVARTHIAAVLSVFSRVETRRRRDDIRMRQRTRHARITMQTAGCRNDRTIVPGLLFTMKIPTTACGGANGPRGPGAFTRVPAAAIAV